MKDPDEEETVSAGPAYGAPPEVVSPSPAYGAPPAEGFPLEVTALLPSDSAVLEHLKDLRAAGFPMAAIVDLKNQLKTGDAVVQKEVIRDWEGLTDFRLSVPYTGTFLVYAFTYLGKAYRLNYHDLPRFVREHDR